MKEQIYFFKRLSFLVGAHVPLAEALSILQVQMRQRRRHAMLQSIVSDVRNGQSLSHACNKYPRAFSHFSISMIHVGEQSGTLAHNLAYIAEELQKKHIIRRKVVSACVYPLVITFATLEITTFLLLYLFPKIIPVFASLHTTLPLSTRVVIATSIFLEQWGVMVIAGVALCVFATWFVYRRNTRFRYVVESTVLRLPVAGTLMRTSNVANCSRTLGLLLTSGMTLLDALPITARSTKNLVYREQLQHMTQTVERGEKISKQLTLATQCFPEMVGNMVAVGERSGTLSQTLVYVSDMCDKEVDEFTKNLSSLIEPMLMICMGLLVGFIAVAIITPIYGITQNIHA